MCVCVCVCVDLLRDLFDVSVIGECVLAVVYLFLASQ